MTSAMKRTFGRVVPWSGVVALIVLASVPFLLRYRVNRARHGEILDALAARKNASKTAEPLALA